MDAVFRALADAHRRQLLDALRHRDGQTLGELVALLPMTRFGAMKHLRVLEQAQLVVRRRHGRHTLHFLNPVPIQEISARWLSPYAAPFAQTLIDLKQRLESEHSAMTTNNPPKQVYEVFIRATPQAIWEALTSGALTPHYYYDSKLEGDWRAGGALRYLTRDGHVMLDGEVISCDPPNKLVTTFRAHWNSAFSRDRPSRVTWEITPLGAMCKLTLVHDDFGGETATFNATRDGWPLILSGLKTLLETGKPLAANAA